jgi:hypothetical protein
LYVKKASGKIDKKHIANFITFLKNTFDEKNFKLLANTFIGRLGKDIAFQKKYSLQMIGKQYMQRIMCILLIKTKLQANYDIHFVKLTEKTHIFGDISQIFRQILSEGMIQLLELIKVVYNPKESVLVGYNTDAIFIDKLYNINLKEYPMYRKESWKPKKHLYHNDSEDPEIILANEKNWVDISHQDIDENIEQLKNTSLMCVGGRGCDKTEFLKKLYASLIKLVMFLKVEVYKMFILLIVISKKMIKYLIKLLKYK